jgi:YfiH family protein
VRAACSVRTGGVSSTPHDSLNLGDHVGDAPSDVARNRELFAQALGVRPVYLKQVHGRHAVQLQGGTRAGQSGTPDATQADACATSERGLACTIMVADCMPVLFATGDGKAVAAAHAGWRGLASGVLESAIAALREAHGDASLAPDQVIAWLGPCIGPQAFEVGLEVKAEFEAQDASASACFKPHATHGKWLADLPSLARKRLRQAGIASVHGNDGSAPWCTVANPSIFFSHRRDRVSGRFAAAIWLD